MPSSSPIEGRRWTIGICPECEQDARACEAAQNCRSDFTATEVLPIEEHEAAMKADRARVLTDVAEAFETRSPAEAMRCSEVALYCREQAALASLNQKGGE